MTDLNDSITRRGLLTRALGAAAFASTLDSASRLAAETQTPVPRIRDSFDFGWKFFKGDAPGAQEPAFADASWRTLDLPHDWSIEGPFSPNEPSGGSGGYAPTGIGWYRKQFRLPATITAARFPSNSMASIRTARSGLTASTWASGRIGYISFAYDLTPHLNLTGDNVVAVKVDNSRQPSSRWYTGSGIYRHTWLSGCESGARGALGNVCDYAASLQGGRDGAGQDASAAMKARLRPRARWPRRLSDPDGQPVQTAEASQEIGPHDRLRVRAADRRREARLSGVWRRRHFTQLRSTVRGRRAGGGRIRDALRHPRGHFRRGSRASCSTASTSSSTASACTTMAARWAPPCRSAFGSGASRSCARWAATPSAPATIRPRPSSWTSATAWASW